LFVNRHEARCALPNVSRNFRGVISSHVKMSFKDIPQVAINDAKIDYRRFARARKAIIQSPVISRHLTHEVR
jgi:hypothetical protein